MLRPRLRASTGNKKFILFSPVAARLQRRDKLPTCIATLPSWFRQTWSSRSKAHGTNPSLCYPLTIGKPHLVDHDDIEEVWTGPGWNKPRICWKSTAAQTSGMSFYHISDNKTPYTNIKQNEDSQVRFLYFARDHPHQPRPVNRTETSDHGVT